MLNTLRSFTPTVLTNTCTKKKSRCYVRIARATVVSNSTNSSTVGSITLFVCLMTLPVHFVVALPYALDFTTPLYRNIASVRTSSNIPRCVRFASNECRLLGQWHHVCTYSATAMHCYSSETKHTIWNYLQYYCCGQHNHDARSSDRAM
jgi:hypothetical protein